MTTTTTTHSCLSKGHGFSGGALKSVCVSLGLGSDTDKKHAAIQLTSADYYFWCFRGLI